MGKYSVSIVWIKHTETGINVSNTLQLNIDANSEEEAFGICYEQNKKLYPSHSVHSKISVLSCK